MRNCVSEQDGYIIISIRVTPKSSRRCIGNLANNELKVYVHSAAESGKANDETIKLIASALNVSKSSVCLISGEKNRSKLLKVANVNKDYVCKKLNL